MTPVAGRSLLFFALAIALLGAALALVTLPMAPAQAAEDPVIHGIEPPQADFRAWVVIAGAHFGSTSGQVTFAGAGGGRYRATTRAWSDSRIEAEVPYNTVPGDVVVRTADGRSSNGYPFSPPCWARPEIRQILPGRALQCEVVKILGCGFGDFQYEQVLTFNGVDATGRIVGNWSDKELLVRVPEEATSGPVIVTNKRRVPSAGFPFQVRDDAPEWARLATITETVHAFDIDLRVGEQPEEGAPREIRVEREHWQRIGDGVRPDVHLTPTWQTATTFSASAVDPGGGRYTIAGVVDPAAATLRVTHSDVWQVELWDNSSSRERKICDYALGFTAQLPLGRDVLDRPDFNVWAPRWGFGAGGAELGRRAQGLEYRQACFIYNYAGQRLRRDGVYELLGVDWAASSLHHGFTGTGKDPCRDPNPTWDPVGQLSGRAYAVLPPSTSWVPEFTGFPLGQRTVALPGARVRLLVTPPGQVRQELASTVADDGGYYRFDRVPLTNTLELEVTLEDHGAAPAPFAVTYRRANGAARGPVMLRTAAFSNRNQPLLTRDVVFSAGAGASTVDADHLDDVALSYAHVRQAWQAAGALGLTLDLHAGKGEPLEIRSFSPEASTYWHGDHSVGPNWGRLAVPDNIHVNIDAPESLATHGDRPMNREWHELGHHVLADVQGDLFPRYWVSSQVSDTNHAGRLNPTSSDSWTEGFAEFFSTLVEREASRHPQAGLYRMNRSVVNLDQNFTSFSVRDGLGGQGEEMAVAALLWDLVDSAHDGQDARPLGINQALLDAWGVKLNRPLSPADVRWPPTLYYDRVALDDRVLLLLVSQADKIAAAYGLKSGNSAPDYPWLFDVGQLYRTLAAMGVAQERGAKGLTALDELFIAHGFFADTAPQNLSYDQGEVVGATSNLTYTVTTTRGPLQVPGRANRHAPAPAPEAYLRYSARDATSGAPLAVGYFDVAVTFAAPFGHYSYQYQAQPATPGRLPLVAPDPIYETTLSVTARGDHLVAEAPFTVTGEDFWRAVADGAGPDVVQHSFTMRREPWLLWLPRLVVGIPDTTPPYGVTPVPPTPPSSAAFAAELLGLINAERQRAGRTTLAAQPELAQAASWYAGDMAASGEYRADHSDRLGRTMPERLKAFAYTPEGHPRWHVAENMARGQTTPTEVLAAWLASPPHRANILDRDACEAGLAHALTDRDSYRHYWVVDFGCRAARPTLPLPGATGSPTATPTTPTATVTSVTPSLTPATPSTTPGTPGTPTTPSVTPLTPGTPSVTPPTPSPTPTSGPVLFDDDFCDPASGWPTADTVTVRYGYLIGMGCSYRMQLKVAPRTLWVTPRVAAPTEFSLMASGYPIGTGAFGLLFGLTPARDRYYVFLVDTQRRYGLFRNDADTWTAIVPWTASGHVDPEFGNSLRVESLAGGLGLYLEDHLLTGFSSGESYAGEVGLYAETNVAGFDARFTRFRLAPP